MTRFSRFAVMAFASTMLASCGGQAAKTDSKAAHARMDKPNVVVFYIDDLGYGDLSSYGAVGVKTPNVDKLVKTGIKFTDAHTSAATCTPSRYSLLTGEYAFRSGARVLKGDAPALIQPGKPTLPAMLKKAGYTTGVVGKWHLGLGNGNVNWNSDVKPGPLEIGFDYSFLLPATGDRVPTVYLDGHTVVGADASDPIIIDYKKKVGVRATGHENPELLRYAADSGHDKTIVNGISRIGYMGGGENALWVDEDFPDVFTDKALDFIRTNKDKPFFLFHSFHDIHVPRLPHPRFKGKSDMGWRGDAIVQMDWMTGQVMKELETLGIADNTLVIFTSDNGPVLNDGYSDDAFELLGEHKPGGPYSGGKYSAFEGATRVPTVVTWPAKVKPGESDALMTQVDIYASLAAMLDVPLSKGEAIDSQDMMAAFTNANKDGRTYLFYESPGTVSLRKGNWKYIHPVKNERALKPKFQTLKKIASGHSLKPQLFDLSKDPAERNDIAASHPEIIAEMTVYLETVRAR